MYNYLKCVQYIVIYLVLTTNFAHAWDTEQLEVFDVVEEIDKNFYAVLNITEDADLDAIKKAFRSLSRVLHPDKNDAADADVQFRNLVSVYDVLRDPVKRAHYNDVLKNGLPNWRSAVYYYRHVRKMGLMESLATLFVVITIGQYLVAWGAYIEKKYTAEQMYNAKLKKQQRKRGGTITADISDILSIPKPSFRDTLPIQIPCLLWAFVVNIIPTTRSLIHYIAEQRTKYKSQEKDSSEDEEPVEQRVRQAKKRKTFVPTDRPADDSDQLPTIMLRNADNNFNNAHTQTIAGDKVVLPPPPPVKGGLWTDDDLADLAQLVNKYPGGTTERWEKIAEAMQRSVAEVTYMAAKLKDNCYRLPQQQEQDTEQEQVPLVNRKQKTRGGKLGDVNITGSITDDAKTVTKLTAWSQLQQKALEAALAKYPKGPADRWDKIAKCVPDKSKEECMLRYKYLVELVKKQKEKDKEDKEMEQ